MRMNYVRVRGRAVTLPAGLAVRLSEDQAARHAAALEPVRSSADAFRLTAPATFKAGEVLGVRDDFDVDKHARGFLEDVLKSDWEAHARHLAARREASTRVVTAPAGALEADAGAADQDAAPAGHRAEADAASRDAAAGDLSGS